MIDNFSKFIKVQNQITNILNLIVLVESSTVGEYLDPFLVASELEQIGAEAHEQYGLPTSIIWKLLLSENGTKIFKKASTARSSQSIKPYQLIEDEYSDYDESRKRSKRTKSSR